MGFLDKAKKLAGKAQVEPDEVLAGAAGRRDIVCTAGWKGDGVARARVVGAARRARVHAGILRAADHARARGGIVGAAHRARRSGASRRNRPAGGLHAAFPSGSVRARTARSSRAAHDESGADVDQLLAVASRPVRAGPRARAARGRVGATRSRRPADRAVIRSARADRGRRTAARVARRTRRVLLAPR